MPKPIYLVVTPFFPSPTSWRGAYCFDFVSALTHAFAREVKVRGLDGLGGLGGDWRVEVFVPGDGTDYDYQGVRVRTFKTRQLPSNVLPFLFRRYNERSFLNKVREVLGQKTEDNGQTGVSVCHAHTANFAIYALAAKQAFGCRALLHHHDPQSFGLNSGIFCHCSIYNAFLFLKLRALYERIDCHVFISNMVKRSFELAPDASWTTYGHYRRQMRGPKFFQCRPVRIKRSIILHNGVDIAIFNREVEVKGGGGRRNCSSIFTIGCIGNFVDWKDQETLIRAVGLLKEPVKVIFVGSGPTLETCKRLANSIVDLHLRPTPIFEFRAEVRHEQLAEFYRSLDLFVLPSYFEGFGCVFTEAYACGVPFVTCKGQGMDDLVKDESWLIDPGDAHGLATKIELYIKERGHQVLSGEIAIGPLVETFIRQMEENK